MASDYGSIRRANIKEYGEGTAHLDLFRILYSDRTHFLFELLQNAEDAGARRVHFRLCEDRFELDHDGRPFTPDDVAAICGVGQGTKREDYTQIGRFGIGFKSVFAYTASPEVHCGDEHFRIESYVRPHKIRKLALPDVYTTRFVLPFSQQDVDPDQSCAEIAKRLENLSPDTLLFLRSMRELSWSAAGDEGTIRRKVRKWKDGRLVSLTKEVDGEKLDKSWLVFHEPIRDVAGMKGLRAEIAFALADEHNSIRPLAESPLVAFFPTEKETHLGFLMQGPYRTTPARDNVPEHDSWNQDLVQKTAGLVGTSLHGLKKLGLMGIPALECMPIKSEHFPDDSMFAPIAREVNRTLRSRALIPAADSGFVSGDRAVVAETPALRDLLSSDQLTTLLKSSRPLKWVDATITSFRHARLFTYITDELQAKRFDAEGFGRQLTAEFLRQQPDEWIDRFYAFCAGQRALWQRGGYWGGRWVREGVLRTKQIIRLARNRHILPFTDDDRPAAYLPGSSHSGLPSVKQQAASSEEARAFLSDLGLPEPDLVAEVLEYTLPRYQEGSRRSGIKSDQHLKDVTTILAALAIDSVSRRGELRKALRQTRWILARNAVTRRRSYRTPSDIYLRSESMELYLDGNRRAWFLDETYDEAITEVVRGLGVASTPRLESRDAGFDGYVTIERYHGHHRRGCAGFDPGASVDGLVHALANPALEKSAFIWNAIAEPNLRLIRGIVESSSRKDYSFPESNEMVSPMGRVLIESRWLPTGSEGWCTPKDTTLADLPQSFRRNEDLARQLRMSVPEPEAVRQLVRSLGLREEAVEVARKLSSDDAALARVQELLHGQAMEVDFPVRNRPNPDRRAGKVRGQAGRAPRRKSHQRKRTVRISKPEVDARTWLRHQYSNVEGQLVCQICESEMPFRTRKNEYYFEAVESVTDGRAEHHALFLALCPVCAAKFKEYIKCDREARVRFAEAVLNDEHDEALRIPVELCGATASVRFVETHLFDLRVILAETVVS